MAQFYNDRIDKLTNKITNGLSNKDSELNILFAELLDKYIENKGVMISKEDFNTRFNKIYNADDLNIKQLATTIFKAEDKINLEELKEAFEDREIKPKKVLELIDVHSINELSNEIVRKLDELRTNSYKKYLNLCFKFNQKLSSKADKDV